MKDVVDRRDVKTIKPIASRFRQRGTEGPYLAALRADGRKDLGLLQAADARGSQGSPWFLLQRNKISRLENAAGVRHTPPPKEGKEICMVRELQLLTVGFVFVFLAGIVMGVF